MAGKSLDKNDDNQHTDVDNDTFEDASENTPRQRRSYESMANETMDAARNPKETPDRDSDEQYEHSEVLFSSDETDQDKANGQSAPLAAAKANITRVLDAASEKLEKVNSSKSQNAGQESPAVTSPQPEDATNTTKPPRKKLFSWLSRSNADFPLKSPPLMARTDTQTSIMSNENTSGTPGSRPGEDAEETEQIARRVHRNSLKDRFKLVRMREEAGIVALDDDEGVDPQPISRSQSIHDGTALVAADSEEARQKRKSRQGSTSRPPTSKGQPMVNESLAPGTASGTFTGPSAESDQSVDWDLWQEVVYEGPAAVARTSADELKSSIRRGIPSAIRGVVWQVLAESKNEDLEAMYAALVARGLERERRGSELRTKPRSASRASSGSRPDSAKGSPPLSKENDDTAEKEKETEQAAENDDQKLSNASTRSSTFNDWRPRSLSRPGLGSPKKSQDALSARSPERNEAESEQKRVKDEAAALQKLERAIQRDLGSRTSFSKFLMSAGLQDGLFGICKAYALFDEEVGYAQGMNFIAMPLLFNMPEEEAFCLFVRLMNKYGLRDLFIHDMPGLHLHLYQFERLLEDLEPALYCHLKRRNVHPQLYATQWFLTLFAYRFPLQLVLRIYDLILSEGLESAILKFGIVLMQKNAAKLLEMKDMAALTTFLKERIFDYYIDKTPSASSVLESGFFGSASGIDKEVYRADALVHDACEADVTPEMLRQYAAEWEEKVREEKEQAAEAEALRTNNATLTQRVRKLEKRAQELDQEHVQLASDLVHTKIANQTLADENESLKTRVDELQVIVDEQPAQVEERLRSEMERIMTRNAEVQHENRALEESGAELEAELATAKLNYAEIAAELEGMRRKWNSVSSMMSGVGSPPPAGG